MSHPAPCVHGCVPGCYDSKSFLNGWGLQQGLGRECKKRRHTFLPGTVSKDVFSFTSHSVGSETYVQSLGTLGRKLWSLNMGVTQSLKYCLESSFCTWGMAILVTWEQETKPQVLEPLIRCTVLLSCDWFRYQHLEGTHERQSSSHLIHSR